MFNFLYRFSAIEPCASKDFFGLPRWYKYLKVVPVSDAQTQITSCTAQLNSVSDIWLIVAAVIEILLRIATIVAIGFVVWGGIQFIISQGEPDKTHRARSTVINALIGLVIAVAATTIVSFVASRFTK